MLVMRNVVRARSGSTAKLLSRTIIVMILLLPANAVGGCPEATSTAASSSVRSSLPSPPQTIDKNSQVTVPTHEVSGSKDESADIDEEKALDPEGVAAEVLPPLLQPPAAESTDSILQGLTFSDTVSEILKDARESLSLFASEIIVDFETQASLIVESYRADLSMIVQETLQRRRRRRRKRPDSSTDTNQSFWRALGGFLHEGQYSQVVLSELSKTATYFSNEVERRQREQRRRVKRKAILLAPLIFVAREHDYHPSSDYPSASQTMTVVGAASVPHSRQPDRQGLRLPHRRRKRSHRGFETFSQTDSEE
jgi:hypothetical protein